MIKKILTIIGVLLAVIVLLFVFLNFIKPKTNVVVTSKNKAVNDNLKKADMTKELKQDILKSGAEIISQKDNDFKIKLLFKADKGVAKRTVRYYLSLYKVNEKGEIVGPSSIDYQAYNDQVVLKSDDYGAEREINYKAPSFLSGKYALMVDYINESAYRLEEITTKTFVLNGNNSNYIEIYPGTCRLSVSGNSKKEFDLIQGIDVKSNEELVIKCSVQSHFPDNIFVEPEFTNYRRKNFYLNKTVEQENISYKKIELKPLEVNDISFPVKKALSPQAYDASFRLIDNQGREASDKIFVHYIVAGESATIHNASLDKVDYLAGEEAKVLLNIYGSADVFNGSRFSGTKNNLMKGGIDIKDQSGTSCLGEIKTVDLKIGKLYNREESMIVTKDCESPYAEVTIIGSANNILDEKTFLQELR